MAMAQRPAAARKSGRTCHSAPPALLIQSGWVVLPAVPGRMPQTLRPNNLGTACRELAAVF